MDVDKEMGNWDVVQTTSGVTAENRCASLHPKVFETVKELASKRAL